MKSFVLIQSVEGVPIMAHLFGYRGPRLLLLGGVHGDESEGVALAQKLLAKYHQEGFPYKLQLLLIPILNIDGVLARTRKNSAKVDLNRNLPTKDWTTEVSNSRYWPGPFANSEPENRGLVQAIDDFKPVFIMSFHSFERWMININGDCRKEAQFISRLTGYPAVEDIGYPTPGSLGTYAGKERGIPTITYELKKGERLKTLLPPHVMAVDRCLQFIQYERALI